MEILRPYRFFYWSKEKKYEKEINAFSETLKKWRNQNE